MIEFDGVNHFEGKSHDFLGISVGVGLDTLQIWQVGCTPEGKRSFLTYVAVPRVKLAELIAELQRYL